MPRAVAAALTAGILLVTGCSPAGAPATVASADRVPSAATAFGWGEPAWRDEFDGTAPSPGWLLYDGPGHAGNGLRRPEQVTVADGVLSQTGTVDTRSGGMLDRSHRARFGRWEVRARAAQNGQGSRPYHAVVALIPADVPYDGGYRDVDFLETDLGSGRVSLFVHYPPNKQDYLTVPIDLGQWHTYAVETAPDHVTWFVDGVVRASDRRPQAVPTTPMALNVQLDAFAPAGLVAGRLQVDWARFHVLPDGAPTPPGPEPAQGVYDPTR